ncbi:MAG: cohesin domain-containing protein, partial [Tepidisphaeraceae bacterium]
ATVPATDLSTPGTVTVQGIITDAYGLYNTYTFQITVNPVTQPFQVTNFTQTASGFDVTFNRAANPAVLNLYAGTGGIYGGPDVILTGPGGTVTGSLVLNSTGTGAEFIKTGQGSTPGVLAAGVYTATLVSSSTAWEDLSGNLLQSNDPSGNYVHGFTVGALGDIVSLSDFARGPGQAVNLPTTSTAGIPINLSNGSDVTAVDFYLAYDSNLLTITGVNPGSGFPANGWSITFNNSTPGQLQVTVSGTTPLASGVVNLVDLVASVPSNATYGLSAALNITNLMINGGAIAGTADS